MKYTQIPATAFQNIQLNAGILVDQFTPETGAIGNLIGATTGGVNFTDTPQYTDFGDDIDNCPKNMMELKVLDSHEVKMSGTFVTVTAGTVKMLAAVADVDAGDSTHIVPRNDVLLTDYESLWWIGDYSDVNTGENAGFIAIKLFNALNTGGFQIKSADKGKGQFAFEFTGHYSMNAQDTVPYEIYVKSGSAVVIPAIKLSSHYITITDGDTATLTATTVPAGQSVTWASASETVATVSNGIISAENAGNTIITASITYEGVTVNDTCTVVVVAA